MLSILDRGAAISFPSFSTFNAFTDVHVVKIISERTFPRLIELASLVQPLDLEKIFGRVAPLHVDLGCGDGDFLFQLARQMPERNFLGIERLLGRSQTTARKAEKTGNMRALRIETSYAVAYLLPPRSVEKFYLLFPDPWPKRRHQRRRVFTAEFLDSIRNALDDHGLFHVATDQRDYFEQIDQLAREHSGFAFSEIPDAPLPQTKFERRFLTEGAPIYRLELRKTSSVT